MQKDSIRDNITKEDLITSVHMELDADTGNSICFVFVEGSDDVEFVEGMFCEEVRCYESFSGKHGLEELLKEPDLQDVRVIAVRDRDYMKQENVLERMFLYDYSCLELLLLSCKEITSSFFRIYYEGCFSKEEYLLHIMKELAPYSVLRKKNEEEGLGINFQKIGFGNLIDTEERLDAEALFLRAAQAPATLDQCRQCADGLTEEELMYLTNGHDICLFLGCVSLQGKKGLGETGVRQALLNSYRKTDFEKTNLYQAIKAYQYRHGLKYVD